MKSLLEALRPHLSLPLGLGMRKRVSKVIFPDQPGVYVVYERKNVTRPLYVGVAKKQSLRKRWWQNHLRPRAGGSALRRSLGVHLGLVEKKLRLPRRYYPPEVEAEITNFLERCFLELFPTATGREAIDLERELIARLRPRLNVVVRFVKEARAMKGKTRKDRIALREPEKRLGLKR